MTVASNFMTPMEDAALGRPSAATEARNAKDCFIRSRGFAIVSRPNKGEPIWEKNGVQFKESELFARDFFGIQKIDSLFVEDLSPNAKHP